MARPNHCTTPSPRERRVTVTSRGDCVTLLCEALVCAHGRHRGVVFRGRVDSPIVPVVNARPLCSTRIMCVCFYETLAHPGAEVHAKQNSCVSRPCATLCHVYLRVPQTPHSHLPPHVSTPQEDTSCTTLLLARHGHESCHHAPGCGQR